MKVFIAFTCFVAVLGGQGVPPAPPVSQWVVRAQDFREGIFRQPADGSFGVVVLDDTSALGHTIGVVCLSLTPCMDAPWGLSKRFWQDERWSLDVTAFAWDLAAGCLYVSTSAIYGDGGLFALDLKNRRATRLLSEALRRDKNFLGTTVTAFDPVKSELQYQVEIAVTDKSITTKTMRTAVSACQFKN